MTLLPIVLALIATRAELPVVFEGKLCHSQYLLLKADELFSESSLKGSGLSIVGNFPEIQWRTIKIGKQFSLKSAKELLLRIPGVVRVEGDRAARPAYNPNDPIWPDMWHFVRIKADAAWDLSIGSPIPVAVIDTGVERTHPDLAANIWSNTDEIPGNNLDDDNNGYIDDVNGFDFAYLDAIPDDQFGHGTPCAGLVGAIQDNAIGVTGVAPRAKIMCLKACYDSGYFFDHMTIPAYLYAANNGARVLSMSFFSDHVSAGERDAINYCWANGVVPVAAAANENSTIPLYPAAYENVVSVAAQNRAGQKAGFSNFGTWVDVIAPGTELRSVALGGNYTSGFGGTSGACPHVAGLATLLFGAQPLATNAQVRAAIEDTAILQNQPPFGDYANYGLVDCRAAMQAILGPAAPVRSPVVRYMTPLTYDMRVENINQISRIYGRGFQSPAVLDVRINNEPVVVVNRSRDWIDIENSSMRGVLTVRVNGTLISSLTMPNDSRRIYPAIEASTQGAYLDGGFAQMMQSDGSELVSTRRDDGTIFFETSFRKVERFADMRIALKRRYANGDSGTETISLYDWSSASYPYGSFVTLSSIPVSPIATESEFGVPNASRYIDDEGTVICRIQANGVNSGAELRLDMLRYVAP